LLSCKTWSE